MGGFLCQKGGVSALKKFLEKFLWKGGYLLYMKYLITESQLKVIINEQPDSKMPFQIEKFGYKQGDPSTMAPALKAQQQALKDIDPHTLMTIAQIGTAFIPFVGLFISAGIGLSDAAMYYNEGDKKTAGLIGVFSAIPGVGGLATKLGLTKFSAKALGEIGKKISFGSKLTPLESQVANRVAQYRQLIQTEMNKIGKGTKNVASQLGGYAGVGLLYDKAYDKIKGQEELNFDSIDVNKISQANKTAALNVEF